MKNFLFPFRHFQKRVGALMLFILSLPPLGSQGQVSFPAAGATWHHEMAYGSFYGYVAGDTVIQGKAAKIIHQEPRLQPNWSQQGLHVLNLNPLAVFTRSDTTFIFNKYFNRFTPLYIWNAKQGDSICLPLVDPDGGKVLFGDWGDSTFCFVVDSIRAVIYDQQLLRTFYTRSIRKGNRIELNWGSAEVGAYADRIGGLFSGILPQCIPNTQCLVLGTDTRQSAGRIRCYRDLRYSIKLVPDDCENTGHQTSIHKDPYPSTIGLGANPVRGILNLKSEGPLSVERFELYAASGHRLLTLVHPEPQIDLSSFPPGLYFAFIETPAKARHFFRIILESTH